MATASGWGEGYRNRRNAWGTAALAAFVALLVAAIGAGGVWVGTRIQADRDDERSNREFLQTQRVELYGEFLAQVDANLALMADYSPNFLGEEVALLDSPAPSSEQYSKMEEGSYKLSTLAGRVLVLSGADVRAQADMLQAQVNMVFNYIYNVDGCHKDPNFGSDLAQSDPFSDPGDPSYCTNRKAPWLETVNPYTKRQEFLLAVREELGIPE